MEFLPALPSLQRSHLRAERASTALGELVALVPAAAPYSAVDPGAPTLLLIPGLGVDGWGFIRQLPLGSMARLHLFHTPNDDVPGEIGLGRFARFVEEYILAAKLEQCPGGLILGGNSMGGAIALLVAMRGRVRLRGLVLIGTFGSYKHLPVWQRGLAPLAWVIPMGALHSAVWRIKGILRTGGVSGEEARWIAATEIKRTRAYFGAAVAALNTLDLIENASKLTLPCVVIHGSKDPVLPHRAAIELAQTLPHARLVTVENAGHSLYFTHAEAVNTAVAEFLSSIPAKADDF